MAFTASSLIWRRVGLHWSTVELELLGCGAYQGLVKALLAEIHSGLTAVRAISHVLLFITLRRAPAERCDVHVIFASLAK